MPLTCPKCQAEIHNPHLSKCPRCLALIPKPGWEPVTKERAREIVKGTTLEAAIPLDIQPLEPSETQDSNPKMNPDVDSNESVDAETMIRQDRESVYGHPFVSPTSLGMIWSGILNQWLNSNTLPPIPPEIVQLMMAGCKLGRLSRTPEHADSKVDLTVYLNLATEVATARRVGDGKHFRPERK